MKAFNIDEINRLIDRTIIVYGTGVLGELTYYGLQSMGITPDYYCDHDPEETKFMGITVLPPTKLANYSSAVFMVAFKDYCEKAIENLKSAGCSNLYHILPLLELDFSFFELSHRAQEMLLRRKAYAGMIKSLCKKDAIRIQHLELMVTERCSLRCKDCSSLVPWFKAPEDIDLYKYKCEFDKLVRAVDFISELSVLGGEPFLNNEISGFMESYVDCDKIGMIAFYTNGTVIPNAKLLEILSHEKIWVHISNYGNVSKNILKLTELFDGAGVKYFVRTYSEWQDAGNFRKRGRSEAELKKQYENCFKARCYSFYKGKLYCCARASNGAAAQVIDDDRRNSFDFNIGKTELSDEETVQNLKEWLSGPYFPVCDFCDGLINGRTGVKPAIQIQ